MPKRNEKKNDTLYQFTAGKIIWSVNGLLFSGIPFVWSINGRDLNVIPVGFYLVIPLIVLISMFMIVSNCDEYNRRRNMQIQRIEHDRFMSENSDFNKKMDDIERELDKYRELKKQMAQLKENNDHRTN